VKRRPAKDWQFFQSSETRSSFIEGSRSQHLVGLESSCHVFNVFKEVRYEELVLQYLDPVSDDGVWLVWIAA
jgi:hypothetical protein